MATHHQPERGPPDDEDPQADEPEQRQDRGPARDEEIPEGAQRLDVDARALRGEEVELVAELASADQPPHVVERPRVVVGEGWRRGGRQRDVQVDRCRRGPRRSRAGSTSHGRAMEPATADPQDEHDHERGDEQGQEVIPEQTGR